jgi:hypothetical protein
LQIFASKAKGGVDQSSPTVHPRQTLPSARLQERGRAASQGQAKQHDWKKKLNQCLSQVGEACKDNCKKTKDDKKEEKSSTAPPPTGEKIEDNPCYGYCRNESGGPEVHACVLDCVQRTSCTPTLAIGLDPVRRGTI